MAVMMQTFYWDAPKHENKEHEWWNFVAEKVESGRYTSAAEVVSEALRLLEEFEQSSGKHGSTLVAFALARQEAP